MNNELDWHEYYFNKKILILGGLGFIGSNLAKELINFNSKVIIVDGFIQNTGANIYNIRNIVEKINLFKCKIEDLDCLPELVEDSDIIIDSMAFTSHSYGIENPIFDTQINLLSHLRLISALKNGQNKKVVYLGSTGQYGNIKVSVITEDTPQNPIDPQGINKVAAESLFRCYANKYGFKGMSLRITNCFGENQKVVGEDIGLIGSLIRDGLEEKTIEIYGNKSRRKNIIYVKDLVRIILALIMIDSNDFEIFNIAGLEITLGSFLDKITKIVGKFDYIIKPFPVAIEHINIDDMSFSDFKIRNKIGELKYHDMNEAITNTVNYFRERLYRDEH